MSQTVVQNSNNPNRVSLEYISLGPEDFTIAEATLLDSGGNAGKWEVVDYREEVIGYADTQIEAIAMMEDDPDYPPELHKYLYDN